MNFSVVCIARNEAKTLPRLLASLEDFKARGGEVVIVDTGSTDDTAQIARDWGCKVEEVGDRFRIFLDDKLVNEINTKFVKAGEAPVVQPGDSLFDFSSARNYAATLASNDMIATPDPDEVYTKLDLDKLNEVIASGVQQLEYHFVFSHDEQGNELIKFMHSKFYDRRVLQWTGVVHEVLTGNATRQFLDESIIKLEHWQNQETNRTGYLKGLALDCFLNPGNDRNAHYFGRELLWTGRPHSAVVQLTRHIDMGAWPAEAAQSMIYIGDALQDPEWYHKAYLHDAGRREPLIKLADYFYQRRDAARTVAYTEAALTIPNSNYYANFQDHYENYPHEMLYWAYFNLGDREKSDYHFDQALNYRPLNSRYLYDARFRFDLPSVSIIIPTVRPEGFQRCLNSIKALNYPQEKIDILPMEGAGTVPEKVKALVARTNGEYICYAADDMEFTPDSLILAVLAAKGRGTSLVSFSEGPLLPDKGNINTHFIFRRARLHQLQGGELFSTDFHHVGCDNWLWAQCAKLGEAYHHPDAKIIHNHFSKGAPNDDTYQLGWSKVEQDRKILQEKLKTL